MNPCLLSLHGRSEVKKIVHRMSKILFAAQIAFRRLDRCVSQQELNLFQLSSAVMTQLRTGPPQVVGCDVLQARSPTAGPDHVPHDILRNALAPYLGCSLKSRGLFRSQARRSYTASKRTSEQRQSN